MRKRRDSAENNARGGLPAHAWRTAASAFRTVPHLNTSSAPLQCVDRGGGGRVCRGYEATHRAAEVSIAAEAQGQRWQQCARRTSRPRAAHCSTRNPESSAPQHRCNAQTVEAAATFAAVCCGCEATHRAAEISTAAEAQAQRRHLCARRTSRPRAVHRSKRTPDRSAPQHQQRNAARRAVCRGLPRLWGHTPGSRG